VRSEHSNIEDFRYYIDAYLSIYYAEGKPEMPFVISRENVTKLEEFVG